MTSAEDAEVTWLDSEQAGKEASVLFEGVRHKDDDIVRSDVSLVRVCDDQNVVCRGEAFWSSVLATTVGDDDRPAELCGHDGERFGVFACAEDDEALWRCKAFAEDIASAGVICT